MLDISIDILMDISLWGNREITSAKARYERGLDQLDDAQKQVVTMQETLKSLQPQLIIATQDVERMLLEVDRERQEVSEFEQTVKIDENAAEVGITKYIYTYTSYRCTYT